MWSEPAPVSLRITSWLMLCSPARSDTRRPGAVKREAVPWCAGMTARSHSRGHNRRHERPQREGFVMTEPAASSPDAGGRDFDARTQGLMATPRPVTSERPLGYWAFGCSLLTWLSLAIAQVTFRASFCGGGSGCYNYPNYTLLLWIAVVGFVAGVVTTGVLAIWALVRHRQPRWAVAALVIILAPYVPAVVDMWS